LVIPFYDAQGALIGVFDIDSDQPAAFDQNDADQLQSLLSAVFSRG
jgi:GAF domain-containing protein